jgi:acetyl esterase
MHQPRPRPNFRQRLQFQGARLLFALPASLQVRLSGRPALVIDESTLHPQMQLLLALYARLRSEQRLEPSLAEARAQFRYDAMTIAGPTIDVGAVADVIIDAGDRSIGARHYAPAGNGVRPLLVYYHGGGFVIGDLDTHDTVCRRFCRDGDMHVLSIDYRLAPEHPFPAAVDDAHAAFRWAVANAKALGTATDQVAVGGDSAGGNLAAVVAQKAAAENAPAPRAQLLLYPTLDRTRTWPSVDAFGQGFFLDRDELDRLHQQYTGTSVPSSDPAQNPLCAASFAGLAPALIVTAGFDALRDEAEAYARALTEAGVPTALRRYSDLLHGFCNMATFSSVCDAALRDIVRQTRAILSSDATRSE